MCMPNVIGQMLAGRRLERVEPNCEHALAVARMVERHVATAKMLAETDDQGMAFTAAEFVADPLTPGGGRHMGSLLLEWPLPRGAAAHRPR